MPAAAALALVAVAGIAAAGWFYVQNRSQVPRDEVKTVQTKVARHYLLPGDEVPALATVTDKAKLKTSFFRRAENNDKILIYQKNKIAIIYRPSSDRIVGVGPVDIGTAPPSYQKDK